MWLVVNGSTVSVTMLIQAVRAPGDHAPEKDCQAVASRNKRERDWLLGHIRQAASQTLAVPSP